MSACDLGIGLVDRHRGGRMQSKPMEPLTLVRSLPLFHGMSDDTLLHLAREVRFRRFQAGDGIVYQGDPGSNCHIIVKGRVRVFVTGEDGRELAVRILGPGEIIGEMALFDDQPRSASIEALEETVTLELHRDVFISCLQRSPALALSMLRDLSARLRYVTGEAGELASLTVPERLLRRLRHIAGWAGKPVADGIKINLPMTQQELAALVGTSRESINRALVRLRREGKVRLEDGWIVLLDE